MPRNILKEARLILQKEKQALELSAAALDDNFVQAVRLIQSMQGKVVVTGVGKSGLIGQKIAATLASTGTPAIYMHATDALHGDLGMVGAEDIVLALSNSGNSDEILNLVVPLRRIGAHIIALVGNTDSQLARTADLVIRLDVPEEALHLNLAPTASTLATLAIGDALAGCVSKLKKFGDEDYALYHPAGAIGRKLLLTVADLMHSGDEHPVVTEKAGVDEVLAELTDKRLGGVNVVTDRRTRRLSGIITDGDLKRMLKQRERFFDLTAADMMTAKPTLCYEDEKAVHALELMENRPYQIDVLPVLNRKDKAVGILRLHDLVGIR